MEDLPVNIDGKLMQDLIRDWEEGSLRLDDMLNKAFNEGLRFNLNEPDITLISACIKEVVTMQIVVEHQNRQAELALNKCIAVLKRLSDKTDGPVFRGPQHDVY